MKQIQQSADAATARNSSLRPAPASVVHPSLRRSCHGFFGAFIPAIAPEIRTAGIRSAAAGALANVGTHGYYWASSPYAKDGTYARCGGILYFHADNASPLEWTNRANAVSVRCVQHLP